MAYCNFNTKLFEQFTSMKTKIYPALSDDWSISTKAYRTDKGFMLESEKLNQKVADINLRRFLEFCKIQNVTIVGNKLQGKFIVGNDRSVYTEDMYNQWYTKYKIRTHSTIDPEDLVPGHEYQTICGSTIVYLGSKWESHIKHSYADLTNCTVPRLKYFVLGSWNKTLKDQINKDLGRKITEDDAEKALEKMYQEDLSIVLFSDDPPPEHTKRLIKPISMKLIKNPSSWKNNHALIAKSKNKYYVNYYTHSILRLNDGITFYNYQEINIDTLERIPTIQKRNDYWGRQERKEGKVASEFYRLQMVFE